MAMTIKQLIDSALRELQDPDAVRWSRPELLDYFNAGQRALIEQRPDQVANEIDLVLAEGFRQMLPDDVQALIDITNNTTGRLARVTKTQQWMLDSIASTWRSQRASATILHYMHDLRQPREFLVYPPAAAGSTVRAIVAKAPTDASTEESAPSVPALWMDALRCYVLFRAWSKDAEYGGNATLAAAQLQLFNQALGLQAQSAAAVAPTV